MLQKDFFILSGCYASSILGGTEMKQTTDFLKMKERGEAIAMLTAYDYPSAKQAEQAGYGYHSCWRFLGNGCTRI